MECMKYGLNISLDVKKVIASDYLQKSKYYSSFTDGKYIEMEITNDQVGMIIGNRGENINRLRKHFKSKILISNEYGKRFLYISSEDKFNVFSCIFFN